MRQADPYPERSFHGDAPTRHHHERRDRAHGHEPAPDPLDQGDPRPRRRAAGQRRPRDARPDPDRPQRREDRRARAGARRRALEHRPRARRWPIRDDTVFFDAATTQMRPTLLAQAIAAGKHVYCEKPVATNLDDALAIYRQAQARGIKHGVVQDKLFLPGLLKLKMLIDVGLLRPPALGARRVRLLGVRGRPAADAAAVVELPQPRTAAASSSTCSATGATCSTTCSAR